MGDDVWVEFDDSTGIATISGTGDMWDYYENGYDYTNKHQNPFAGKSNVQKIVISEGVTNVGDYFYRDINIGAILKKFHYHRLLQRLEDMHFKTAIM